MSLWNIIYVDPLQFIPKVKKSETPGKILAYCNELLKEDPENILAFLIRGMTYTFSGQVDQAIKAFGAAKKIAPDNKYSYFYISIPFMIKLNNSSALDNLNRSLKLDPHFAEALLTRSSIYSDQGSYEKALADLNTILKEDPQNIFSLKRKSTVLAKMGRQTESLALLEDAYKRDTANLEVCSILAEAYIDRNLSEKAPTAYFARYNLGLAQLRSGNIAEARKVYAELNKESGSISVATKRGAIKDLNELKSKGAYTGETKAILRDFFGM